MPGPFFLTESKYIHKKSPPQEKHAEKVKFRVILSQSATQSHTVSQEENTLFLYVFVEVETPTEYFLIRSEKMYQAHRDLSISGTPAS